MYIKDIVIDGFKSYAQRTEINTFDPQFNAITGLNGSGKSNILDAICFLLGITNLSHIRASTLQELVYKNGQAGVTKATVTVTFDNTDKNQSPVGYETCTEIVVSRQVVIGGRNKYMINGNNATNIRVQDMFRSVQLNINNPHFLIMQGRITKVLNMKPIEILSMIEEAAGTRMYESKREQAQKTIEKKDSKLKDIVSILDEEILPTLTKLKEEKSSYLKFKHVVREIEHLTKFYVAYQFFTAEELEKGSEEKLTEIGSAMKLLKTRLVQIDERNKDLGRIITELEKQRDEDAGGMLKDLEQDLTEKQRGQVMIESKLQNEKDKLSAEEKNSDTVKLSVDETTATKNCREIEVTRLTGQLCELQTQHETHAEETAAAQKHLQAVTAGLSTSETGQDATLADQIMACKHEISQCQTGAKQAEMKLKHSRSQLKQKEGDLRRTEAAYNKDKHTHDIVNNACLQLKKQMDNLNYNDETVDSVKNQRKEASSQASSLQEKIELGHAQYPQFHFQYSNPEQNFNRQRVIGLLANLFTVHKPQTAVALETVARAKLYNVVVDTEVTGKLLLDKGQLKRRHTFIPLNKIQARKLSPNIVKKAKELVGPRGTVELALTLIGYDNKLSSAMEFVFGTTLVCDTMENARKVAFHPQVMTRTVTLHGDDVEPSGVLSGGSLSQAGSALSKLQALRQDQDLLEELRDKISQIDSHTSLLQDTAEKFDLLKQQCQLKEHEAELLNTRLQQSAHHQLLEEIQTIQSIIVEQTEILEKGAETKREAEERCQKLEKRKQDSSRENELKEAEKILDQAKKTAEKSNKQMKSKQQDVEAAQLEIKELDSEINGYKDQLCKIIESIEHYTKKLDECTETNNQAKESVKEAATTVRKRKEALKERNKDITSKTREQLKLAEENTEVTLKQTDMSHTRDNVQREGRSAKNKVSSMLSKYEWIASERQYFGKPATNYDFEQAESQDAGKRLQKLQDEKDKLSRHVNMRAMNMLGEAEDRYSDLTKKKKIVETDKNKIQAVIDQLDVKKNEALRSAYGQVNKDFGSIFKSLLPGAFAKLAPPSGETVLQGLQIKVRLGDVWKESLTELSGGQRSLVGLSLILSLLLFKPAPLYILDEVDAALDLSHTQNIGQIIRSHFKHSQFVIVSLKDGMFNNANVLFKTRFVDGVSTVTRYVQNNPTPKHSRSAPKISTRSKQDSTSEAKRQKKDTVA